MPISESRKGENRVFIYLPERCYTGCDYRSKEGGKSIFQKYVGHNLIPIWKPRRGKSIFRKDVNSDLMPIWKQEKGNNNLSMRKGEENFSLCRKDAKVGFCASDGP